jgi:hypothetical protein
MYQNVLSSHKRLLVASAAVILLGAAPASAQDPLACRDAIANAARKYTNTAMKALQKCEEGVLKGKIMGPCPDSGASTAISGAAGKMADKINGACSGVSLTDMGFAGKVNRCTGGMGAGNRCVDHFDCEFPPVGPDPNDGTCDPVDECPAFLNGTLFDGCSAPLTTSQTVADCIECAALAKAQSVIDTFYGSLDAASTDKDDLACQKEIGKRAAKYFDAVEKALTKCERGVIKGKIMGPCPDAGATDKINGKLAKLDAKILDACADAGRVSRAIKPGALYSTAGRYGSCGLAAAGTGQGVADLLQCIADNSAKCDVALATGSNACSTQLCGNGQIDPGETCDFGDTLTDSGVGPADVCPSDCTTNTACVTNGTVNVTVSFASDVNLSGMVLVIPYNDDKVSLPGPGASDVSARLSSVNFTAQGTDLEYGLRASLTDPSFAGVAPGTAITIQFDTCTGAPALTNADLGCMVVDETDATFTTTNGASCTATVGP